MENAITHCSNMLILSWWNMLWQQAVLFQTGLTIIRFQIGCITARFLPSNVRFVILAKKS